LESPSTTAQIADGDRRSLAGACAGVVEKQEDAMITTALLGRAIWRGEERVDLGLRCAHH
jgi:hypothetical protein